MNLDGKRVLVTGADGFIGSHLTEHLVRAGCEVRAFVQYNSFGRRGWLDFSPPEIADGLDVVRGQATGSFDLIFADAWPGKYDGLDAALALLAPGGLYIIDDMLPQPNWPDNHQARVDALTARLKSHPDLATVSLSWASGLVIAARRT